MAAAAVLAAALVGFAPAVEVVTVQGSGALPPAVLSAVAEGAAVVGADAVVVDTGTLRLLSVTRGGVDVQRPPAGFGYPMAVAAQPSRLADRSLRAVLRAGEAVVSERSAALRGAEVGDVLTLEGWNGEIREIPVGALAPDAELGWAEIVLDTEVARRLGLERPTRVEVRNAADAGVARLAVETFLPRGDMVVVSVGPPPPPVLPDVLVKERFGEFSFRPHPGDDGIDIDEAWVAAHIVTVDLPRLGTFRCHRLAVPYLRRSMEDVVSRRLGWLVDREDFQRAGGCYSPRLIRGDGAGFAVSRHAWGAAVDLNPSSNPFGGPARMESRLVDIFGAWGFAWGGGWLTPDPMHFEWRQLPVDPEDAGCSALGLVRSDGEGVGWEVYARSGTCAPS